LKKTTDFTRQVIKIIRQIPEGRVATYGQIAKLAGRPNASRGVVWILHSSSETFSLPWHRVLNSKGQIGLPKGSAGHRRQCQLLRAEGVEVTPDGRLDLDIFQWKKKSAVKKKTAAARPRGPTMFS